MTRTNLLVRPALYAIALLASIALLACGEALDEDESVETGAGDPGHEHDHGHDHTTEHESSLSIRQWVYCAREGQPCNFEGGERPVRYNHYRGPTMTRVMTGGVLCSSSLFWLPENRGNFCEVLLDVPSGSAMDMSMMPVVNKTKIPRPNTGMSVREVGQTSEQATPYEIGAFRTSCQFSHMSFDDPIVFPGQPGKAHLHAYFGNTAATAFSTADSLRTSGDSTCRGGIVNRTAYWVPAVLDKLGAPVKPDSAQIYYKTGYEGVAPRAVQVFPQGLRMIAGDAKAKGPTQERANWACETYNGHPHTIPDCAPTDHVIMMVQFPQCWNGSDLDSSDHKSHMAYPVNGGCPSTHPVAIPEITFNIYYSVPAGTRSSDWRLASDMYDRTLPGGYSAHGDWFEGWDREVAETFVRNCDQASKDCKSHLLGDGRTLFSTLEND